MLSPVGRKITNLSNASGSPQMWVTDTPFETAGIIFYDRTSVFGDILGHRFAFPVHSVAFRGGLVHLFD